MMWMLAELYHQLPEVGDLDKPKLVFFFDEAHLLFKDASKAFLEQVEQVVRLVRSKGVGIFFVTQSPKDIPATILAQLGNRVQHALRAFTPDDEKALRAAARTFPKTPYYDVGETLTTLGIGEALVTVLGENGAPTPPFVDPRRPTRLADGPADARGDRAAARQRAGAEVRGRRRPRERLRDPGPAHRDGRAPTRDGRDGGNAHAGAEACPAAARRERLERGAPLTGRAHDCEPGHPRVDGRAARQTAAAETHANGLVSERWRKRLALTPTLSRKREREEKILWVPLSLGERGERSLFF